jgi:hypothetical protein
MDINKAIRKQKKSYNRFMLAMCFIFFTMPLVLYLSGLMTSFFIIYLAVIETMVVIAVIAGASNEKLKYEFSDSKLKIWNGLFGPYYSLYCDKVALVHVESWQEDICLIILTTSMFRNKKVRPVDGEFLKKHGYLSHEYSRIKKLCPENNYYYIIIKKGGYYKYRLLADMYRNCVKAVYTVEAVEGVKKAR